MRMRVTSTKIGKGKKRQAADGRSQARLRFAAASVTAVSMFATRAAHAANTVITYTNTAGGALDTAANWSGGTEPGSGNDALIDATATTNLTGFTLNLSPENFGSLNDTNAGNITITGSQSLTLGGGSGDAVSGSSSGDLFYVATGGNLTYSGTGGIVLGQSGNFDVAGLGNINSVISDGGSGSGITATGSGTLTLNGANTFGGALAINSGVLATNNLAVTIGAAQGVGESGNITLNGGTLRYTSNTTVGNNSIGFSPTVTVGANGGTLDNSGTQPLFFEGALSGSGSLTFLNSRSNGGQWLITGNSSSFSGNITIGDGGSSAAGSSWAGSGFVQWRSNATSPVGSGTITINTGGVFTADGGATSPGGLTLANNFILNGGRLGVQSQSVTYGGTILLTANSFIGSPNTGSTAGTITLSNVISGASFGLTKDTADTAQFTGANTYGGGTTVSAGTLTISGSGTLGASTGTLAVNNPNTGNATAVVLNLSAALDTTTGSLSGAIAAAGNGTNTATINNGGSSRNFIVNQTGPGTFAGTIAGAGGFTLGSLSTSTLTLTGANTYSGVTTLSSGALQLGNPLALRNSIVSMSGGNLSFSPSIGTFTLGGLSGSGNVTLADTNSAAVNLLIGNNTTASTYSGVLGGTGNITKIGTGTFTLSGNNSFAGNTTVSAGNLSVSSDANFGSSASPSTITLNGGTLNLALTNSNSSAFTLNGNRTLFIGSSGGTIYDTSTGFNTGLTLAAPNQLTGNGTLTLGGASNSSTDVLLVTRAQTTFTGNIVVSSGRLEVISSDLGNATSPILGNGTITVNSGGTLGFGANGSGGVAGDNVTNTIYIAGNGDGTTGGQGALHVKVGSATLSGPIYLTGNATFGDQNAGTTTISGNIAQSGGSGYGLTFDVASGISFILTGTASYSGTTTLSSTGTLQLGNGNTSGSLSPSSAISLGNGTLVFDRSNTATQGTDFTTNAITGNGGLTLIGNGTVVLNTSNSYSGATTVSLGTLRANNGTNGTATGSGNITVNAGSSNYGGGRIGGNGTVTGTITLASSSTAKRGGIITAGADDSTIGTLSSANQSWGGGAAYQWKLANAGTNAAAGTGGSTGGSWDDVMMSGLSIGSGGSNQPFTIALDSLSSPSGSGTYSWIIAQTTSAPTGLSGGAATLGANLLTLTPTGSAATGSPSSYAVFALDTSGFGNGFSLGGGDSNNFSLEFISNGGSGDNLVLDYNSAPEPGAGLLILAGSVPMMRRRRRPAASRNASSPCRSVV